MGTKQALAWVPPDLSSAGAGYFQRDDEQGEKTEMKMGRKR